MWNFHSLWEPSNSWEGQPEDFFASSLSCFEGAMFGRQVKDERSEVELNELGDVRNVGV